MRQGSKSSQVFGHRPHLVNGQALGHVVHLLGVVGASPLFEKTQLGLDIQGVLPGQAGRLVGSAPFVAMAFLAGLQACGGIALAE